jgi:hypothetical protein
VPVDMMIYYVSKLNIDRQTGSVSSIHPKRPDDCRKLQFGSGEQRLEPGVSQISFANYSFRELSKAFNDIIPSSDCSREEDQAARHAREGGLFLPNRPEDVFSRRDQQE